VSERLREGGVDPAIVRTIWSTVDTEALKPSASRDALREAFGVSSGTKLLLAAAHLTHRKGLDIALRALSRCVADETDGVSDAVLWVAGDGPERSALEALVAELELGARVRFLGSRQDIPDLLAAADLLLMPSRSEGLGIAALEAMAAGLPVLGCRVGGLGQAVVDGRTGLLVPPEDIGALADALARLLADDPMRQRLGREGPVRIAEGFRAEQMVEAYEALYCEMLAVGTAAEGAR